MQVPSRCRSSSLNTPALRLYDRCMVYPDAAESIPAPASAAHVTLRNATKDFRIRGGSALRAIEDVALAIQEREFVAIVGPSGCGKSTILRLIAGLDRPTTGTVSIAGRSPADYARQHLLGVAFQQHTLLPWLSVYANVALPFKVARRPVDHDRIRHLLATVGMERFARLRPRQLSGGMCQRAAIAQALALNPEVLLLDEPFGALDAVARKSLNIELQRIWQTNEVTAVLVTHSVDEAVFLADRVIVLSARPGRVVAEMRIDFPRPRTADLFRDGAFNVLTGKIEEKLIPEDSVDDR